MNTINLQAKLAQITDHWHPRIVGALNDSYVKLVKLKGSFLWHKHEEEDELFLVISGVLTIHLREDGQERDLVISPGEFAIIPRGVEHCPVAEEEAAVLLLEPKTTRNTGDAGGERTVDAEWL